MSTFIKPFGTLSKRKTNLVVLGWLGLLMGVWTTSALIGTTHMFPTPYKVYEGFLSLWKEGLVVHLFSSLWLCLKAVTVSVIISLVLAYSSPIALLKPLSTFVSKMRYLPLVGLSFYISILVQDGRMIQMWVLVVFMTTFLVTSLLAMIKDIPEQEFDHARTLGCTRWETLWEVVVKGRLDYVIESVRQNLAIVWMMLVTVESILAAAGGLGFLIKNSDKFGNHGRIIALYIVIMAVGMILDTVLTYIRKSVFRYSKI